MDELKPFTEDHEFYYIHIGNNLYHAQRKYQLNATEIHLNHAELSIIALCEAWNTLNQDGGNGE